MDKGKTYRLHTIKELFENIPRERIDTCAKELGQALHILHEIKQLTGAEWCGEFVWIDDDEKNVDLVFKVKE